MTTVEESIEVAAPMREVYNQWRGDVSAPHQN